MQKRLANDSLITHITNKYDNNNNNNNDDYYKESDNDDDDDDIQRLISFSTNKAHWEPRLGSGQERPRRKGIEIDYKIKSITFLHYA